MMHYLQLTFSISLSFACKQYEVSIAPDEPVLGKSVNSSEIQSLVIHFIAWGNTIVLQTVGKQSCTSRLWARHKLKATSILFQTWDSKPVFKEELTEVTEYNSEKSL